ncbi:DNA polymerase/3'-5' exonuclease PolX [Rhodanobacter sp. KK11]|uniref:DNA polymerase/3'-5' exonuclease PolX n=1 Tax=Rhodanobacter sp. KK11 TaxID=3083255 RepID=UPI002966273F|nr:DNA polymerase/3'-5' exonuclease PolX [Rhodanobacter sp. KK11]MDW2981615.1 DNA polymerase/3'-5' exonuclease PolX [Rhodanobacter sp. KK11]
MSATNAGIGAIFDEIADWLELDQANPFRIRAYRNAARTVTSWPKPLAEAADGKTAYAELPGIGEDLAEKIDEIVHTGSCAQLKTLRRTHPRGLRELLHIPGIGPKRASRLFHEAGVSTPRRLVDAARAGRLSTMKGFGPRMQADLLQAAAAHLASGHRWKLSFAAQQAEAISRYLHASKDIDALAVAGSYRRQQDTVGDLDVLVAADQGAAVSRRFLAYPEVARVLSQGPTRSSIVLKSGLQIDLRVMKPDAFGAALVYFTGSKAHNVALRRIARKDGLKINEYGVYRGARRIAGDTEQSVYATLGLPPIPPELRENRGEIEAARQHRLPALIERSDLRGDLHVHTDASDGHASLADMVDAARKAGLSYVAITDHSRGLGVAHGLDAGRLARQIELIDRFNETSRDIVVLKGIEIEILEDGTLDLPASVLRRLDLVVGAVHSHFKLSRTRQTERIMRAMDQPCFSILAHPSGRLIGEREAYEVDLDRLIRHAGERKCFLEANAHPDRLDLNDVGCRMARDGGVRVAISSDSHDPNGFAALRFGIGQAQRGWLESGDVINTLPLKRLRALLKATMA